MLNMKINGDNQTFKLGLMLIFVSICLASQPAWEHGFILGKDSGSPPGMDGHSKYPKAIQGLKTMIGKMGRFQRASSSGGTQMPVVDGKYQSRAMSKRNSKRNDRRRDSIFSGMSFDQTQASWNPNTAHPSPFAHTTQPKLQGGRPSSAPSSLEQLPGGGRSGEGSGGRNGEESGAVSGGVEGGIVATAPRGTIEEGSSTKASVAWELRKLIADTIKEEVFKVRQLDLTTETTGSADRGAAEAPSQAQQAPQGAQQVQVEATRSDDVVTYPTTATPLDIAAYGATTPQFEKMTPPTLLPNPAPVGVPMINPFMAQALARTQPSPWSGWIASQMAKGQAEAPAPPVANAAIPGWGGGNVNPYFSHPNPWAQPWPGKVAWTAPKDFEYHKYDAEKDATFTI